MWEIVRDGIEAQLGRGLIMVGVEMWMTVNDLVVDAAHLPHCQVEEMTALRVSKVWR